MNPAIGTQAFRALTAQTAVTVDRSSCARHRCKHNECSKCLDVCPTSAISWSEQGLSITSTCCTQCLRCLSVCPTAAFRAPEFSLLQTLADLSGHPEPVLGCNHRSDSMAHGRFPCLGYLAHPELMMLLSLIFVEGLQINLTCCQDCPKGHILKGVYDTHARLTSLNYDHNISLVTNQQELDYRPAAISRRELFSFFRDRSTRAAAVMVDRLQTGTATQSYGNKKLPKVRAMLIEALITLPPVQQKVFAEQIYGQVSFTSTCTACGGCSGICPTGAIQPAEMRMDIPVFDEKKCVSCGSCQAFCFKKGVTLLAPDMQIKQNLVHKSA